MEAMVAKQMRASISKLKHDLITAVAKVGPGGLAGHVQKHQHKFTQIEGDAAEMRDTVQHKASSRRARVRRRFGVQCGAVFVWASGLVALQVDCEGNFVACMHGVMPKSWGPGQWARDGEDFASHMLARFSEHFADGISGVALEVYSGCARSVSCDRR
ncbi:unnamed protein product [Prorocentrum cordatum]|uniref:Uncharacterized protein n=1 Tax=Prorocentrum cordatum TaxID=2364126 RepID=A0ABN9Y4Z2_9DINO|nr:unnamed protein product [Polarella glacialis]